MSLKATCRKGFFHENSEMHLNITTNTITQYSKPTHKNIILFEELHQREHSSSDWVTCHMQKRTCYSIYHEWKYIKECEGCIINHNVCNMTSHLRKGSCSRWNIKDIFINFYSKFNTLCIWTIIFVSFNLKNKSFIIYTLLMVLWYKWTDDWLLKWVENWFYFNYEG